MEYRKNYNTPRERIDDDMLLRILNEEDVGCCSYGDSNANARKRSSKVECGNAVRQSRNVSRQEVKPDGSSKGECCDDACAKKNCLSGYHLAMSYTPDQEWQHLYCDEDAMSHGTIFTELYKPFFHGCNGSCR